MLLQETGRRAPARRMTGNLNFNGGVTHLLLAIVHFFGVGPPPMTVLKLSTPLRSFFYFKNKSPIHPNVSQVWAMAWLHEGTLPPVGVGPQPWSLQLLQETCYIWLHQHGPPVPLEATPPSPWSSGLWQEAWESLLHGVNDILYIKD